MAGDTYIHDDFLLETEAARRLYHEHAKGLPIIDYHCHLPPEDVACDRRWENIAQIWLCDNHGKGDHYKWRAMRANGIGERFITGDAPDREKFHKWAETVPYLLRNQLYPWTHLELARYFDMDALLSPETADRVWDEAGARLAEPWFSARGLMKRFKVVLVCTTDDPTDDLRHHKAIAGDASFDVKVLPAWRPDRGMAVDTPGIFRAWVDRLAAVADVNIKDFASYMDALRRRHAVFHEAGCRLSDHGLETVYAEDYTQADVERAFAKVRGGSALDADEALAFKSAMLYEFAVMDSEKDWTQQFHLGCLRNNNTRMFASLGPDTGFDSIGEFEVARPLGRLFDRLDGEGRLARTIVYSLNPRDNAPLVTMLGNFQDGSCPGKMQLGSAWWHLDQKNGMERQMEDLSETGLLGRFVGMLTDSRSFLSYPRHEYFRRILCSMLGRDMASGTVPSDFELVGRMVRDVSYNNAAGYFGFDVPKVGE